MATVLFYEKPGCANNARQKQLLLAAGHELVVRDLLKTAWTAADLRPFFGQRAVAEWFNRVAPRVKSGAIVPEAQDEKSALAHMLNDPLLIRRPLLQVGDRREVGFDPELIHAWIGLHPHHEMQGRQPDLERCRRQHACPDRVETAPQSCRSVD